MTGWWRNRAKVFRPSQIDNQDGNPALKTMDGLYRPVMSMEEYLGWYDAHKRYLEHEDDLIHYRLGWVLSIHGFLYASYALVLTSQLSSVFGNRFPIHHFVVNSPISPIHTGKCSLLFQSEMYLFGISFIGIGVSLMGATGAIFAQKAMKNVARSFRVQNRVRFMRKNERFNRQGRAIPDYKYTKNPITYVVRDNLTLPGLTGGGGKWPSRLGSTSSIAIPFILATGWFVSLVVLKVSSLSTFRLVCDYSMWDALNNFF